MAIFRVNKESKQWRQFVTWISAILVFPFIAYFSVRSVMPELDFSTMPALLIFGFCWVAVGFFVHLFVKENIK